VKIPVQLFPWSQTTRPRKEKRHQKAPKGGRKRRHRKRKKMQRRKRVPTTQRPWHHDAEVAQKRELLSKFFGHYRFLYNKTLQLDIDQPFVSYGTKKMFEVRAALTNLSNLSEEEQWLKELPTLPRQRAVEEYFTQKKTALERAAQTGKGFEMKRKSKFGVRQECVPMERYRISSSRRCVSVTYSRTFGVVSYLWL